jgi:hypothetical protein
MILGVLCAPNNGAQWSASDFPAPLLQIINRVAETRGGLSICCGRGTSGVRRHVRHRLAKIP